MRYHCRYKNPAWLFSKPDVPPSLYLSSTPCSCCSQQLPGARSLTLRCYTLRTCISGEKGRGTHLISLHHPSSPKRRLKSRTLSCIKEKWFEDWEGLLICLFSVCIVCEVIFHFIAYDFLCLEYLVFFNPLLYQMLFYLDVSPTFPSTLGPLGRGVPLDTPMEIIPCFSHQNPCTAVLGLPASH